MRKFPPKVEDEHFRVEMTVSCRDADPIPKVPNAGSVERIGDDVVQVMHNGVRVLKGGYHGDWMSEVIARLNGHHEPQEELVFHHILKFLPDNARMIELGAFWSYYSIWFLKDHPQRQALGVEPDPSHIEIGLKNAALNNVNLEIRCGFLGSMDIPSNNFVTENSGIVDIPMIRASTLVKEFSPSGLDLLHLDIQGAEADVIRDCQDLLLSKTIQFLLISTHAEPISGSPLTHQECLDMVREFDGVILEEHDVHESFSGDGLIAAYFGSEPIDWPQLDLSYNRYSSSLFRNPIYDLSEAQASIANLTAEKQSLEQKHAAMVNSRLWRFAEKLRNIRTVLSHEK